MENFAELSHNVLKKPTPEKIHRLRILTRQARAALWLHDAKKTAANKRLRNLGKHLGTCRQNDVLLKDAKTYNFKTKHIKKKRKSSYKKLRKLLDKFHIKKIDKVIRKNTQVDFFEDHKKSLQKKILRPLNDWPSNLPDDKKELHKIRITTKKIVYRLEHLGIKASQLKSLQQSLGRLHDLEILENELDINPSEIASEQEKLKHKAQMTYREIRASGQSRIK